MNTNENDVLKVTQVKVFPFKEGPSMGHIKALALPGGAKPRRN